jgi:hypothetical protein
MPTVVLTDRQRAAVQAYLRLLQTVRAVLDSDDTSAPHPPGTAPHPLTLPAHAADTAHTRDTGEDTAHTPDSADGTPCAPHPPLVSPSLLAEADEALAAAGLAGNEAEFFALLQAWCPGVGARDE